jgi:hypothetical protein
MTLKEMHPSRPLFPLGSFPSVLLWSCFGLVLHWSLLWSCTEQAWTTFSTDDFRPMRVSLDGALHDGRGTPTVNCFRQEHQVDRFLSIFEERLTRRAYLRTHGQPTR